VLADVRLFRSQTVEISIDRTPGICAMSVPVSALSVLRLRAYIVRIRCEESCKEVRVVKK
jgi:hypothetical protein